jgi:hypothetical protein
MKAEHRKELETNVLADKLGRVVEGIKSGPKGSYLVWGGIAVAVLIVLGVMYFLKSSRAGQSALWVQLDSENSVDKLGEFADAHRGSTQGRIARFEIARILIADGTQNLGSEADHASSLDKLEKARDLYRELAPQSKDAPLLQQEAMMGEAKAEESLAGSVKNGSLEKAMELYRALANAYPDSFQGKAAAQRVKDLEDPDKRKQIEAFYANLNKTVAKKS